MLVAPGTGGRFARPAASANQGFRARRTAWPGAGQHRLDRVSGALRGPPPPAELRVDPASIALSL
jgi:hypothetical protein